MNIQYIKKLLFALSALPLMSMLTSCDEHEAVDYSWHTWKPGMVYCTNGDIVTFEKCKENGYLPEAVLFYIDDKNEIPGVAYAVSLWDSPSGAFANQDTTYFAQGTSTNYYALDGESNTTALRHFQISSPIALNIEALYFIPSVAEMYKLYASRSYINDIIVKCGGNPLPVDNEDCWYWTSTECDGAPTDRAWRFSLFSGRFESADKHYSFPTRPIMMIRLNQAEMQ